MNWINEYIKDYNDTEALLTHAVRTNCEDENIKRVLESIKTGKNLLKTLIIMQKNVRMIFMSIYG